MVASVEVWVGPEVAYQRSNRLVKRKRTGTGSRGRRNQAWERRTCYRIAT